MATRLYNDAELQTIQKHYVPQQVCDPSGVIAEDSLKHLLAFSRERPVSLLLILAPPGHGKTVLTKAYARAAAREYVEGCAKHDLSLPLPFLVPFSEYRRLSSFAGIIRERLQTLGVPEYTSEAFKYLLNRGRLTLVLDGFDELLESAPQQARENLQEIVQHVSGRGLIVLTSRTTFFATTDEVSSFLRGSIDSAHVKVVTLEGFDERRQKDYLDRYGVPADQAQKIIDLGRFADLARTPQNLRYLHEIVQANPSAAYRPLSAEQVFGDMLPKAYQRERVRQKYDYSDSQQEDFLRDFAYALWWYGDNALGREYALACTSGDAKSTLLLGHHLLRSTATGQFTFEHFRVRDYFLAAEIRRNMIQKPDQIPKIFSKGFTENCIDFLASTLTPDQLADARDRCGRGTVARGNLVALVLAGQSRETDGQKKAASLQRMLGSKNLDHAILHRQRFEFVDLRGWTFRACDLSNAHFAFCDLRGTTFDEGSCTMEGVKFEDCEKEQPGLPDKRQRVLDALRNQVGLFIIDDQKHLWRDKLDLDDLVKSSRHTEEVMDAMLKRRVLSKGQGERGGWFLNLEKMDVLQRFWRDGSLVDPLDQVVDALLRKSRL